MGRGKVYLVGAGPGDPGLITLKAMECLAGADVVVYDFLANPALLSLAGPEAELVYVGKQASDHTLSQEDINRLIVDLARAGKVVVRLKGGDPFVFGRGGEEAEDLARAGLDFEVVPGVTSAIAVPAYAGIPLTHRSLASGVGIITGHEDPTKAASALDWEKIATGLGTLVFLMGVKNLASITERLIGAGRDPATPAALIRWGTTPNQVTLVSNLGDITAVARERNFQPPAVLVVGEVVNLRPALNWYERLPLFGRCIMVTRTRSQASRLSRTLSAFGARVIECPTIRLAPPEDWGPVDRVIHRLSDFDWLVLTSPNGVDFFFERLRVNGTDARSLAGVKLAAIGPATAERLASFGLRADLVPDEYVAEDLVRSMKEIGVNNRRILAARAAEARDVLPRELRAAGAKVTVVALYQTLTPEGLTPGAEEALSRGEIDLVTFTSSSTVNNLVRLLGDRLTDFRVRVTSACIGPITARTAREAGLKVAAEAERYTIDGLVDAILNYFRRQA